MGRPADTSWRVRKVQERSRKSIFAPSGAVLWSEALGVVESFRVCHFVLKGRESGADVLQILQKPHSAALQAVPGEVPSSDPFVPPAGPQAVEWYRASSVLSPSFPWPCPPQAMLWSCCSCRASGE